MAERISSRNWEVILYPSNMLDNWEDIIDELLPYAMCYAIHDKDPHIDKKTGEVNNGVHVHCMIHYNNTTTQNWIIKLFNTSLSKLNKNGSIDKPCCSTAEPIGNMQFAYDYLIHNTVKAKKQGKYLYPESARVCLNNFDIHFLADEDEQEKMLKIDILSEEIVNRKITNYVDFYNLVKNSYDITYVRLQKQNNSYFNTLIKGNYNKYVKGKKKDEEKQE